MYRRFLALLLLCAAGTNAQTLLDIIGQLSSSDPIVAKNARLAMDAQVHRAAAPGVDAERATVAEALVALLEPSQPETIRRDALNWLGMIGRDAEVPAIAKLLADSAGLADDARMTLERIPGNVAITALVSALPQAAPSAKPGIMHALAKRNVKSAIPILTREARNTQDLVLVWAAFDALTSMGVAPNAIFPPPMGGTPEDMRNYAQGWLRAANALFDQGDFKTAERMYSTIAENSGLSSDIVAVMEGLILVKSPKVIDIALGYLGETKMHSLARNALTRASGETDSDRLIRAYAVLPPALRAIVLDVLSERNEPALAGMLPAAVNDEAPEVRIVASHLSKQPPNSGDLALVLEKGAPWMKTRAAELYLERAELERASGNADAARIAFETVARAKVGEESQIRAWQGIEALHSADSWQFVQDGRVAYEKLAPPVVSRDFGTARERAFVAVAAALPDNAEAQKQVLAAIDYNKENSIVVELARTKLRELGYDTQRAPQQQGFLTAWRVAGPMPITDDLNVATISADAAQVEVAGVQRNWVETVADAVPAIVDLGALFGPSQDVYAIARSTIRVDAETPLVFLIGSNDGCEFYVNGERLHAAAGPRALSVDGDRAQVTLKPGENSIAIKVVQNGGAWQFCVRASLRDGTPFDVSEHRSN